MTIQVTLGRSSVAVERKVFTALFDASVAATRADYVRACKSGAIPFKKLVELAHSLRSRGYFSSPRLTL